MITGIHAIFYTKHSKEMYDFLKDVLELPYIDARNGWQAAWLEGVDAEIDFV